MKRSAGQANFFTGQNLCSLTLVFKKKCKNVMTALTYVFQQRKIRRKKKKKQKVPVLNKPLTSVSAPTCFAKQSDVDFWGLQGAPECTMQFPSLCLCQTTQAVVRNKRRCLWHQNEQILFVTWLFSYKYLPASVADNLGALRVSFGHKLKMQ